VTGEDSTPERLPGALLTGKPPQPAAEHAGSEPAASSSRTRVTVWTVSAAACLTWERPVRQCPLASPAVGGDCYSPGYSAPGGSATATRMQTTDACDDYQTSAGSQRCLRSCMPAVARPRCCISCCTELTLKTWAPSQSSAHHHRRGACGARGPRGARGAKPGKGAAWASSTSASLAAASERVSGSNASSATMLRNASAARAGSSSASLSAASKRSSSSSSYMGVSAFLRGSSPYPLSVDGRSVVCRPVPCGLRREHSHAPGPACHCLAPVPGMTSREIKLTLHTRLHRRE
jgi:hypothetical protein